MGLTISYNLSFTTPTIDIVHEKVLSLQKMAKTLGFIDVEEIVVLKDRECTIDMEDDGKDPHVGLKIRASEITGIDKGGNFFFRHPSNIIGFTATPGEGCTSADFGFRRYQDQENPQEWTWFGYCKTQYASNPEYGGLENFMTSHLKIVNLLDAAQTIGIHCDVSDNGEFWETRDRRVLARAVNAGNLFTAAIMGSLKDTLTSEEGTFSAPILEFPNFEYLEGEGQQHLQK
jgi:hypothetical protein